MQYTEFRFRNFKGIGDMTLPLAGDVTTLIGLNESGKTTILEAIFCFSYGAENLDVIDPSMASLRDPEQWIPISLRANFNGAIVIEATVVLDADDHRAYRRHMRAEFGLKLASVPQSIAISEWYDFENSRFVRASSSKSWGFSVQGTKGKQKNVRAYASSTDEWQGAVTFFKERLPRIWYLPKLSVRATRPLHVNRSRRVGTKRGT